MSEDLLSTVWRRRATRRRFVRGLSGLGAATGIVSLAGCTPAGTPAATSAPAPTTAAGAPAPPAAAATTAPTPARQPKRGGVFRQGIPTDTANMDVHQNVTAYLHVWGPAMAYSKLVKLKADPTVKPLEFIAVGDLAESWQQADDTTYVFKMRSGAKFHNLPPVNGREVVAEDVKYSFERQTALRTNASRMAGFARIDAPDKSTLRLVLTKPDADMLVGLAHYHNRVVPKESVDANGDLASGPIIGSGPFMYEKWERNAMASLVRNPDYYERGLPYLDRLEFPRIGDTSTRLSALRTQQIDYLQGAAFTPKDAESVIQGNPDLLLEEARGVNSDALALNSTRPPFDNIKLRQAVAKAIDRQQLIDTSLSGKGWLYPGFFLREEDRLPEAELRELSKRDVAAARRLLSEAGFNAGTSIECYVSTARESTLESAQLIQQQLAEIGMNIALRPIDTATGTRIIFVEKVHQMYIGTHSPAVSTNSDLYAGFYSTGTQNRSAHNDRELDAMIDRQAVMTRDPEGRKRALLELQRYLINSAHQIALYGLFDQRLRWKYVQDHHFLGVAEEPFAVTWMDK
jgi:peptide/nickel transport system substrate-binding protein